jgi:hypothetical protein
LLPSLEMVTSVLAHMRRLTVSFALDANGLDTDGLVSFVEGGMETVMV